MNIRGKRKNMEESSLLCKSLKEHVCYVYIQIYRLYIYTYISKYMIIMKVYIRKYGNRLFGAFCLHLFG